jgi:hypothetical protein
MMRIVVSLIFLLSTAGYAQAAPMQAEASRGAAEGAVGASAITAIKVSNVPEEYKIARKMKLRALSQSLVTQERSYDVLNCLDKSGKPRELWFDISSFYPGSLGAQ